MLNTKIVYKYIESPLGKLIIGATSKGCCVLAFQDKYDIEKLKSQFKKNYRLSMVEGTNSILDQLEMELAEYFKGELQNFTVTLDLKGTSFEKMVWKELLRIPYGETKSYGEIAKLINNTLAVRAVGRANGKNPVAIIVPCHRVISSDGKLHGYGGGLWRKKELLILENQHKSGIKKKIFGNRVVSLETRPLENWFDR
ncbi:MAG: methylated-DNA--[protein]-cysteine S-methyltransferase [Candidatus Hodarchaeota archaeon]